MGGKYGFMSSEHKTNYETKVQRNRSRKQPVKVYTGDDLVCFAKLMGLEVSPNHKPPQAKRSETVEINVSDLPESLRKLVK